MVHRKSNYVLTFKNISSQDRQNLYEENKISRHLYGTAHQIHQPLPYEDDVCECDDIGSAKKSSHGHEKQWEATRSTRRVFTSASMGPVRPSHEAARTSMAKQAISKNATNISKFINERRLNKSLNSDLLKKCLFCGKEFYSVNDQHLNESCQKEGKSSSTTYQPVKESPPKHFSEATSDPPDMKYKSSVNLSSPQMQTQQLDNSTQIDDAVGAMEEINGTTEKNVHFSKFNSEQCFLGVLKSHPVFKEYDLLPATSSLWRPKLKLDRRLNWNAQGDRPQVPAGNQSSKSKKGLQNAISSQQRLSSSTGNIAAQTEGGGLRASSSVLHSRARPTLRTAATGPSGATAVRPRVVRSSSSPAPRYGGVTTCRHCSNLYWGRSH
ncbi:uncharacterized protein LOC108667919 [Hyalella azteca]|uniref:Uncharacterized protein LOC108667919 n=1 Tax=Hyalella azteca TaxID=294128 RepID=A0A8B7NA98_HYAAZ|nr:uncharacterized protein LOC108667919 [Hyalella azteca]